MADLPLSVAARRVREAGEDAIMLARLTRDLPPYLRVPLTVDRAREIVRQRLVNRERRFLDMVDGAVYGHVRSPYRRLLAHVGCERGDLHALVAREGVEGTLRHLADQGVYVTFDEFKGRPAVRGSARFTFSERDFDNPLAAPRFIELTSGSRGRPTRVRRVLGTVTDTASMFALVLEAHGIQRPRNLFWVGGSPSWSLAHFKLGHPIDAWLYPIKPLALSAQAGLRYLGLLARLAGHRLPALEHCDVKEPETIVRWLTERPADDRPMLVNTRASSAVRVAIAAAAMGRSLEGVTFHCRSEMLSAPRRRLIEQVGARALPDYATVELSSLAYGCAAPLDADDVHLGVERFAVVERRRPAVEDGPMVDALLFTTLSPSAPKIGLNTEPGDSARVEQRECGCPLGALGLTTHLSEIRSFEKLSSEGTTFARADVLRILEEILPARFGGTAMDYQVVEEEAPDSSTLLILRVDPVVGPLDEDALRTAFLQELGRGGMVDRSHARLIERAESIVVQRRPPLVTPAGKVLPFQLSRYAQQASRPT